LLSLRIASIATGATLPSGRTCHRKELVMATNDKSSDPELVACEVCLKEVPLSEATVPEALDYVAHFCGLECYEKWKQQGGKPDQAAVKPNS
jgi:hypothetical protein